MPTHLVLPRHRSDAWLGGLAIDSPGYVTRIAAAGGTVVAAAAGRIYRMRPGATRFESREIAAGDGDVLCVAAAPHRAGRPGRFAYATCPHGLHVHDGEGLASVEFPDDHGEIVQLTWAPLLTDGDATVCPHVRFDDGLLLRLRQDDGGGPPVFETVKWPGAPHVLDTAVDEAGGAAVAAYDEENGDIDVWILTDPAANQFGVRPLEAPCFPGATRIAVAGMAVAVSFEGGGVWLSRDVREHPFVELEELRGLDMLRGGTGAGAIAFEGAGVGAALFAAVCDTPDRSSIVRVDAEGRAQRIAELTREGQDPYPNLPMIPQLTWDATRRTLWAAAGHAGVMCATAPGSPPPIGDGGAIRAPS